MKYNNTLEKPQTTTVPRSWRSLFGLVLAAIAVSGLVACGGGDNVNPTNASSGDNTPSALLASSSVGSGKVAVAAANAQIFNLYYKDPPLDNPLKGFVPYQPWFDRKDAKDDPTKHDENKDFVPHSMEWFYVPLSSLQKDYEKFDWTEIEQNLAQIKGRGRQAVFRVYLDYPGRDSGVPDFLSGVRAYRYTAHGNSKSYSPDYTNPDLQRALMSFIKAFGEKYDKDDRVAFITAGLLGFWGEWHTWTNEGTPKVGDIPQDLEKNVVAAYTAAFPNKMIQLRGPVGGVDMTKHPRFGFHDDSFAFNTLPTLDWYFWSRMQRAGQQDNWKTAPMGGEVRPEVQDCIWNNSCERTKGAWFKNENYDLAVSTTHATWMINSAAIQGKWTGDQLQVTRKQHGSLGYNLHVPKATLEPVNVGQAMRGSVFIENRGVAPFYYPWAVKIAAVNAAGQIVQTWPMPWDLRTVLPGSPQNWAFNVPNHGLALGNYKLMIGVPNPMQGGRALRFSNTPDSQYPDWLSLGEFKVNTVSTGTGDNPGGNPGDGSGGNPSTSSSDVTSMILVNAINGSQIRSLSPTQLNTISLQSLGGQAFSIRALPDSGPSADLKSVRFETDAGMARTDFTAPWSLLGNRGPVYKPWIPTIGQTYTIAATGTSRTGAAGKPLTVKIKIEP
jgi:Domain of unknown function (DUF4832)